MNLKNRIEKLEAHCIVKDDLPEYVLITSQDGRKDAATSPATLIRTCGTTIHRAEGEPWELFI